MFELDFSKGDGLIPAIAQDHLTNEVLMLAYISKESWAETLKSGYATYYSRSRKKLWKKGESSGNLQKVHQILVDCDRDTVIFKSNRSAEPPVTPATAAAFTLKLTGTAVKSFPHRSLTRKKFTKDKSSC